MSVEKSHLQRAGSPALSGRSSPVNSRLRGEEDAPSKPDKAYRRYAAGIDRALSLFDTALQEWADYISFLGRLLKALQLHPPGISDVPHKTLVAQRLAQCLHPPLGPGVHQKAIEVYGYIFSLIGKDGLGRDLSQYLPGLSPVLSFASLSVKQPLLGLFDTFIVALDSLTLRPALKAILLALLPGLEEESSEEFERTHSILQGLKNAVSGGNRTKKEARDASGDQFFWQCLFLATITSPSRRLGALAYLQRHLPHLTGRAAPSKIPHEATTESSPQLLYNIEAVTQPEPGLLVRCFAAGLRDEQLLVQRGFLDLLVTHIPLDSNVLRDKVTHEDRIRLTMAAASVVLRREMSLNRRLWTWFLGPNGTPDRKEAATAANGSVEHDPAAVSQTKYFQQYGMDPLVQGIMEMLCSDEASVGERVRPFRIALALMDRWEIGGLVVPSIFLPALTSVWRCQKTARSSSESAEVLRSANVFFDGVESGLIWDQISSHLLQATDSQVSDIDAHTENLELATFIIKNFNLQEEEMLLGHIPLLLLSLLLKAKALSADVEEKTRIPNQALVNGTLNLAGSLLDIIPGRVFHTVTSNLSEPPSYSDPALNTENRHFLAFMDKVYGDDNRVGRSRSFSAESQKIPQLLLLNALQLTMRDVRCGKAEETLEVEIAILDKLFRKMSAAPLINATEVLSGILEASKNLGVTTGGMSELKKVVLVLNLLETMHIALSATSWLNDHRLRSLLPKLIHAAWHFLSPTCPRSNIEAVRCIWKVRQLSMDRELVESCIATLMATDEPKNGHTTLSTENARRFATLWAHSSSATGTHARRSSLVPSTPKTGPGKQTTEDEILLARPLLLLLGSLDEPKTELFTFTTGWLHSSANVQAILAFLLQKVEAHPCSQKPKSNRDMVVAMEDSSYDVDDCLYYVRTTSNVVGHTARDVWASLLSQSSKGDKMKEMPNTTRPDDVEHKTFQTRWTIACIGLSGRECGEKHKASPSISQLQQTAILLLQDVILYSKSIGDVEEMLESSLVDTLFWSIRKPDGPLQVALMSLISVWLRRRMSEGSHNENHRRVLSSDRSSQASSSTEKLDNQSLSSFPATLPPKLFACLLEGLGATGSQQVLHHWIRFLEFCLPYYSSSLFQIVMQLIDRLIKTIEKCFDDMEMTFTLGNSRYTVAPQPVSTVLETFNGIEQTLSRAHSRLVEEHRAQANTKVPEQSQGFFGNMVSGVFQSDAYHSRSATANNRLTVILCFKDVVKLCLRVWAWDGTGSQTSQRDPASLASFNYTSLRLKNRARRTLEQLFTVESLECLETLIELWSITRESTKESSYSTVVLNLLHVLDGSRPRNTMPAIFDALYSRTNPSVLDADRKSTLTSELSDIQLARFLVEYTRSLEDDTMDEIWNDSMTFLKDVLANPLPHRQILPKLLEFTALLGVKVDNTGFGDNRKRRRELGDLFLRQLAATFTIKPINFATSTSSSRPQKASRDDSQPPPTPVGPADDDIVVVLAAIFPNMTKILVESDRIMTASTTVSTQVFVPALRWKSFPHNVTPSLLDLLMSLSRTNEAAKVWRKDLAEAFNDSRFFCRQSFNLASSHWLPLLQQWIISDKERLTEFLSRIPSPTSAGIMFGVGASSARLEADRRTQLNLRRVATLLLAGTTDSFMMAIGTIQEKVADLLTATAASSPSSSTRAEIYMVLQALVLKTSAVHLAPLWPLITTELQEAISSLYPGRNRDKYNMFCIVHACKLLDLLIVSGTDEFQMRQWLFITDSIDAVYRPHGSESHALVDDLAEDLDADAGTLQNATMTVPNASQTGRRKPLLSTKVLHEIPKEKLVDRAIRPFLRQLSINAFEGTYSMTTFDWQTAYEDLLFDIFDEQSLV